ncbi:Hypothetical protein FKW44_018304, partial [Caligus rogercresseyi]
MWTQRRGVKSNRGERAAVLISNSGTYHRSLVDFVKISSCRSDEEKKDRDRFLRPIH